MISGHFSMELTDGSIEGDISVFLVHVDCFSSGQVSEDDAVVLDDTSVLLVDFLHRDDLALDLSDFVLSLHVVPILGASQHCIASKHSHSVERGFWDLLTWKGTTDNLELSNL